jgi:hypothetical protein
MIEKERKKRLSAFEVLGDGIGLGRSRSAGHFRNTNWGQRLNEPLGFYRSFNYGPEMQSFFGVGFSAQCHLI